MATNESGVPARLKDLKASVKERFLGLLGLGRTKLDLIEDEQEVYLQVGRQIWHAPRQLRVELWLSSLTRRHTLVAEYQAYLEKEITREASVDIEKDVQRTFPSTRRFHSEEGQAQLRNVLRAYAAYDPEVAYCQGMNFLTGLLLMYMPTEGHAFAALVVLMEDRKLRNFYHRSMSLLQVQLWQLSRLIRPALNRHLEALGVVPMLYGASWLMTAFSADFPLSFSARIMDVLLADQCEGPLLKVAVSLMKAAAPRLLGMMDLEEVLGYLKIEIPSWEEHDLHDVLQAAFTKPWTKRQLDILRSTEGAETVAQAMDRVLSMIEQAGDEDDDGDVADARVAVSIPRIDPPPRGPNSSAASYAVTPTCGTPVGGGPLGTGSIGGAGGSPVMGLSSPKCLGQEDRGGVGCSEGGLQEGAAAVGSTATWAIPNIHPNVQASPAIQAFRRAHLPCLVPGTLGAGGARQNLLNNVSSIAEAVEADADGDAPAGPSQLLTCVSDEWGDFSGPSARQHLHLHWRSLSRSAPGNGQLQPHSDDDKADANARSGGASGAGTCASAAASMGGGPMPGGQLSPAAAPTQPIPVPGAGSASGLRAGGVSSAFAAVASVPLQPVMGRPPLPPRYASFDRAAGPCSRLSVVTEDPLAVQMGPTAPAPSPRGSMDCYPLGRGGSQQLEGCDYGLLLCGRGSMGGACDIPGSAGVGGGGGGIGSASCNGDCASGSNSVTTGGAFMSPSGISGAVSPHAMSPRILSGWNAAAGAALGAAAAAASGGGGDTPTVGYVPLGLAAMERAGSDMLLDAVPQLLPPFPYEHEAVPLPTEQRPQPAPEAQKDMAADIAGDILRMLTAVDTGSATNVKNERGALHDALYADSPHKEPNERLFRGDGERSFQQLPSCTSLAEMAALDLAKAQEEAERVRQELDAQMLQQRAERGGSAASAEPSAPGGEAACGEPAVVEPAPVAEVAAEAAQEPAPEASIAEAKQPAVEVAAEAPATASGGSAGGAGPAEELVLRRPTLYVDGIPMFDPRGLMADSHEAKAMFTPTVSPGAGSYNEALMAALTPTGDAAAAGVPDVEAEGEGAEDGTAAADGPEREELALATPETGAAAEPVCTEPACAEPASPPAAEPPAAADAVPTAPSPAPSEWVDWSQAPPIQAVPLMTLDPEPEAPASPAATAAAGDNGPSPSCQEEQTQTQQQQGPDLIDMSTPSPPPQMCQPNDSLSSVDAATGMTPPPDAGALQPGSPPGALEQEARPSLDSFDSVHVDAASVRQRPYGLLPETSVALPTEGQLAQCLSFVSTVPSSGHSTAHGGAVDPSRLAWTQLRTESFAASDIASRMGSQRWDCAASSDTDDGTPRAGDGVGVGHPMPPRGMLHPHGASYRLSNLGPGSATARPSRIWSSDSVAALVLEEGDEQASPTPVALTPVADDAAAEADASTPAKQPMDSGAEEQPEEPEPALDVQGAASAAAEAEALPQMPTGELDREMSEADAEEEAKAAAEEEPERPGATTPLGHQGSCEAEGEGSDGDTSPYRAALSPSLAHHIMSAYLRSEQHEMEQQLREREREGRLQQQQGQEHPAAELDTAHGASAMPTAAADAAASTAAAVPALPGVAAPSLVITARDLFEDHGHDLSTPTLMAPAAGVSGLASPALGSPSRIAGAAPGCAAAAPAAAPATAPGAAGPHAHAKALTPFAVSLDDPTMSRLSAEVLQALPPPMALLQPETPTPAATAPGSGSFLATTDPRAQVPAAGSLGCADGGEGEGDTAAGKRVGACGGLHTAHSITIACIASGAHAHAHPPTHPHPLPQLRGSASQEPPACSAATSAAGGLHPPAGHAPGTRSAVGSSGGAMPPLLPPPPPPAVPLAQTTARPDLAASTHTLAPAAPAPHPTATVPLPPLPVHCISAADVMCVAGAAEAPHVAGVATAHAAPQPEPPSWTATFDDAPVAGVADCRQQPQPAAADPAQPPLLPTRGSTGTSAGGAHTPHGPSLS